MKKISKPILELSNICRSDKKGAVERLDLSVPSGESFAVIYSEPGGISLLLEMLGGRISPKKGKIFFKGDDITGTKNVFGVVKKGSSFPKLKTVAEAAAAPVVKRGLSRALAGVLVQKEIAAFGLGGIENDGFSKLSTQTGIRALIFAAYMCSHELIVIDEPFSEIAGEERINELEWLSDLRRRHNISLLVFTQDIDTAVMLGDYVMVVDKSTSSKGIIAVEKGKEDKVKARLEDLCASVK